MKKLILLLLLVSCFSSKALTIENGAFVFDDPTQGENKTCKQLLDELSPKVAESENKTFEQALYELRNPNGNDCNSLGGMYRVGQGVKQDDFKAAEYYQKACGLGDGLGCNNLGLMYEEVDTVKALEYFGKACDKAFNLCSNLGFKYEEVDTVKQDYFKAAEYYQKACGLDIGDGCNNLGSMYYDGKGVRQSNHKALKYYGKACDLKSQKGCENYTDLKKLKNQK